MARAETSVAVVQQNSPNRHCLVVSLSTRDDTVIIYLHGQGGRPWHNGRLGEDVFATEAEALGHLQQEAQDMAISRGVAVLGYMAVGNRGLVLLATRTKTVVTLPGNHSVKLVTGSKWVDLLLEGGDIVGSPLTKPEADKLSLLREFTLDNAHFFCESSDITRPFPSSHHVQEPCREFVWNLWLGASLTRAELPSVCPALLQGMAASSNFTDSHGVAFNVALVSRRSCLHPGMRYKARGLNALAGPGNECEVDQLVWKCSAPAPGTTEWSAFTWRRGTVPIWWGAEMKNGGFGDVDVNIKAVTPYLGTRQYFRRLQKRYAAHTDQEGTHTSNNASSAARTRPPTEDPSTSFPITCVNLLKTYQQNELLLTEHFTKGVKHISARGEPLPVQIRNFDWHLFIRQVKERQTAQELWNSLSTFVVSCGMAVGTLDPTGGLSGAPRLLWQQRQAGLLRYNCADSLDRTNAASYFIAVQVLVEQCRRVGVELTGLPIASSQPAAAAPQAQSDSSPAAPGSGAGAVDDAVAGALPQGWEQRVEPSSGVHFYIDHSSKQTLWEDDLPPHILAIVMATRESFARAGAGRSCLPPPAGASSPLTVSQDAEASRPGGAQAVHAPSSSYGLFGYDLEDVRKLLHPQVVAEHASWFKVNGDMNAYLYTSSRAMHSEILNLLLPQAEGLASNAMGGINKLNNLSISVQRRWSNVLSDAQRQQTVELFLGLQPQKHFPSAKPLYEALPLLQDESEDEVEEPAAQDAAPPSPPLPPGADGQAHSPSGQGAEDSPPPQLRSQQAVLLDHESEPVPSRKDVETTDVIQEPCLLGATDPSSPHAGQFTPQQEAHPLSLI